MPYANRADAVFQSTHSVGSGTESCAMSGLYTLISIHPLRGEWDKITDKDVHRIEISIHPLRGEWDPRRIKMANTFTISIHPLRGEWDWRKRQEIASYSISIHPLRGEWDKQLNA